MERYTKVRNIGKGNMGTCYLARDNEDGKFFVIKQVDLAKLNKKERQQSLNEAKVLSALRHPNIINYVDSFLAKKSDHLCIVMEFADNGDLCNKIKFQRGVRFGEDQILDWFIQMVLSLQHMHRRKILHRDVKTQNIFLTTENLAKLGDFGISKALNGTYEQTNTFVGTPYYLSPELILERPYDHMSDVWALGIVLYELMALRHPFNANDMKSLMHRILRVQYDPPPLAYSDGLRHIVGRILTKDPTQRIRLNEILELPIISNRLKLWVQGGLLPTKYIASMLRNKLFPPNILAIAGPFPTSTPPTVSMNATETTLPLLPGATASYGINSDALNDARNAQRAGNQGGLMGEARQPMGQPAFAPKPPAQAYPTNRAGLGAGVGGGFGAPVGGLGGGLGEMKRPLGLVAMPSYTPAGIGGGAGVGVAKAPYATPYLQQPYLPQANPRVSHLPPVGQSGPQYNSGAVTPQSSAIPSLPLPRVQPSLRPLPGNPYPAYNAPSSLPAPTPATDIQSMLAKAAQDRVALRNGRRW
eukprot:GILI01011526.1.p1 GENE.GILI01011526.1~~GILI01011526.1.p1  ORF type:complete len:529 (+),score=93.61 GILI01011526.1:80-1666(+)